MSSANSRGGPFHRDLSDDLAHPIGQQTQEDRCTTDPN